MKPNEKKKTRPNCILIAEYPIDHIENYNSPANQVLFEFRTRAGWAGAAEAGSTDRGRGRKGCWRV